MITITATSYHAVHIAGGATANAAAISHATWPMYYACLLKAGYRVGLAGPIGKLP